VSSEIPIIFATVVIIVVDWIYDIPSILATMIGMSKRIVDVVVGVSRED
jgi:hypothetical protein